MSGFVYDFGVMIGIAAPFAILFAIATAIFKISLTRTMRLCLVGYCLLAIVLLYVGATENPYLRFERSGDYMVSMTLIVGLIVAAILYYPRRGKPSTA
jgi:hypothetical protein